MGFFKLSSQFIPQLKVTAMFNSAGRFQSAQESTLSWNIPEEATRVVDHEKNYTASGTLNYIVDQNTFADLKGGYSYNRTPLRLNDNGAEKIEYFDAGTGRLWGSNGYNETQKRTRLQLGATLTRYQDGLLAGNHELKAGAEYEYASGEWAIWKEENLMINYYNGSPYYFGLDESPLTGNTVGKGEISFSIASQKEFPLSQKSDLRRLSFFAQDSVTFGDRLTLFLGLRLDRNSTGLFNLVKGESGNPVSLKLGEEIILAAIGVNPYAENGTFDWKDVMTWNSLSPRVGLSFDLSGKGKTIFKASYARYSEYIMLDYIFSLSPNYPRRVHQFNWFDEDMDGEVDTDDTFTLYPEDYRLYSEEYYKKQIDPGIKAPYTDEFTIGLSQELAQDFSIRVSFIYKTKGNILENVLYDPDLDKDWYTTGQNTENWWIPFRTIVPSVDAYPETAVTAYYLSNSAPPIFYRIKNVPELKKKYRALELVFKKRMSNNWQLDGSLVLSKATGNIGLGYDSSSGISDAADSPNYFINLPEDSRLDLDRPFMAKLMGTYKFPFDLFLNFYYTYASGTPWARSITIIPPSSWFQNENAYNSPARVYLESPGTRRSEAYNNLDLRIEKEFRLRGSGKFSASVDVLNALGKKSSFNFPNDAGFWFPEAESTNQGIREISPNYLKTALLSGLRVFRLNLSLSF
jgi:hypothetical protein